jgi:hypothetical protein
MLIARQALTAIVGDIDTAGDAAARLASGHRRTVTAGRCSSRPSRRRSGPRRQAGCRASTTPPSSWARCGTGVSPSSSEVGPARSPRCTPTARRS